MKRKLLALLLALVMVLSLLPAALVPDTAVAETIDQTSVEGGAILHCFDWSYNEIKAALPDIKAAGYVAVQTSPVQQPKDYNAEWTDGNQWWKLYQPLGFTIADGDTWLGTKAELTELCTVAEDQYGIKVIVDVVANHLANKTGGGGWEQVNENIDPDLYYPEYFHTNTAGVNDTNRYTMTQNQMGMPDLNTSNQFVQQKVYDFLVECVDCGVDGFRFDAAKHIELPGDADCGSDFWPAILNGGDDKGEIYGIRPYAASKGLNVFIYGESLSGNAGEEWVDEYTSYMALTDSDYGGRIRSAIGGTNAGMLGDGRYVRCEDARGNVVWVESHDTYEDGGSVWLTDDQIIKAWAIVGARADSTALFFARPNDVMGAASSDTTWKSTAVTEVNQFKNHYSYTSGEYLHNDYGSKVTWIERGVKNNGAGVVISKLDGAGAVNLDMELMSDGTYEDSVSGNIFYVSGGKLHGLVGNTGVAVVYKTSDAEPPSPYISAKTLYLKPEGWWTDDGARFAMYLYGDSPAVWVNMYAVGDGYYEAAVPEGKWTGVIFGRMNPNTTQNSFENGVCWNQTENLFPVVGTDCYKRTGDEGEWMKYPNPLGGYYLVGNMNGWAIHPDYKLVRNTADEYMINCDLSVLSRCKVVHTDNGTDITRWYPNGEESDKDFGESGEIEKNGNYNIYFRPGGNDEWSYKYIYAALQTEASGSENAGFYLVGTMTNWKVKEEYKLQEANDIYSIDKHLSVMDQFKVVYSADGAETSIWYPDPSPNYGADDATRIIGSGVYHISFRPNYDGGEGWFNNCIKVSGCPVTVNIVGNSDLITWSLYTSEGDMDLWQHGEEEMYEPTEVIKLENGDNVVPVGWHVGLEATSKNGINADLFCEITFTDDVGGSMIANGGGDVGSRFRTYVGRLGEGPVTVTLTVGNTKPTFMTQSLTLGGEIGVNFYMNLSMLSDAEKASSYMTFTVGTENKEVKSKADYDAKKTGENGTYGFTCYMNAIQMADPINATFHYTQNGEEKTVEKENYKVRLYLISCQQEASVSEEVKDLAKSLINYGHFVQIYLAGIRNWTLNTDYMEIDLIDEDTVVYNYETVAAALDNAVYNSVRTNNTGGDIVENGITYSLVLDSKTAIRVYFRPTDGYEGKFTVTLDGVSYTPKTVGGRYLVEITGIAAHELGDMHTIEVTTANGTAHVEVSALTYVNDMLNAKTGTTQAETDAKNAVCAIYYYYKAADDYKKANPQ